jgi:dienelactone hydrolase
MILVPYWSILETILIIAVFALVLMLIFRSVKRRQANPVVVPQTIPGRIGFTLLYTLRAVSVGLLTFLAIAFVVMIERNIYSFLTETAPAPSEVDIPPDLPFEVNEVKFEGGDGLMMAGWQVPSENGATIILLHGYGGNRTAMLWHAKHLVNAGYGVMMYDERASGQSEGTRRSYGWEDPRDVAGAVRFIETEPTKGSERIGIAGCSIGAQIALQSAAAHPELEAVWADGPSTVRAQDIPAPKNPIMALLIVGNYSLDWLYATQLDMKAPPPMVEQIGDIAPRPIMIVAGGQSRPLFGSEAERVIPLFTDAAGSNAQAWIISEAFHCDGPARRPEEYAQRMVEFFDTAFGITR